MASSNPSPGMDMCIYINILGWDRDRDRENIYIGLEIGIQIDNRD